MLSHYKTPLARLGDPGPRALLRARLRPNQLTVVGLGVSIGAACAMAQGQLRLAALLLVVAGLFDFFDGALARLANSGMAFGGFRDSGGDRSSDRLILLGGLLYYERLADTPGVCLTLITLIGTVMVSYTKARAQSIGVSCEIGLMGRPEGLILPLPGSRFH